MSAGCRHVHNRWRGRRGDGRCDREQGCHAEEVDQQSGGRGSADSPARSPANCDGPLQPPIVCRPPRSPTVRAVPTRLPRWWFDSTERGVLVSRVDPAGEEGLRWLGETCTRPRRTPPGEVRSRRAATRSRPLRPVRRGDRPGRARCRAADMRGRRRYRGGRREGRRPSRHARIQPARHRERRPPRPGCAVPAVLTTVADRALGCRMPLRAGRKVRRHRRGTGRPF